MSSGSAFHNLAAMTGKAWSPSVECLVAGTTKAAADAKRSLSWTQVGYAREVAWQIVRTKTAEAAVCQNT